MPKGVRLLLVVVCLACGSRAELDGERATTPPDAATPPDFVWFKLDETSGTTAHDSSSHHFDMKIDGVTWGEGATFDGTACGSVDVGPELRDPPITMTVWITAASRGDESANAYGLTPFPPNAMSGDTPGAGGFGIGANLWHDSGGGAMISVETGVGDTTGFHAIDAPLAAEVASFVALVVRSANAATVYLDDAVLAQTTANDPPTVSPPRLHLGCTNDDTGYGSKGFFRGRMRDARIYNRALNASDVAALRAAGPV